MQHSFMAYKIYYKINFYYIASHQISDNLFFSCNVREEGNNERYVGGADRRE